MGLSKHTIEQFTEAFWAKVDKNGPPPAHLPALGACWLWCGAATEDGYGEAHGRHLFGTKRAHRISWLLTNGAIPADTPCVLHRCDTRLCVNPAHLFLGTRADNMHDMFAKDRGPTGDRSGWRRKPDAMARGSRSWNAKLSETSVAAARKAYAAGGVSMKELGRRLGVSQSTMSLALRGLKWSHVEADELSETARGAGGFGSTGGA